MTVKMTKIGTIGLSSFLEITPEKYGTVP